jgi:hypothetical protein
MAITENNKEIYTLSMTVNRETICGKRGWRSVPDEPKLFLLRKAIDILISPKHDQHVGISDWSMWVRVDVDLVAQRIAHSDDRDVVRLPQVEFRQGVADDFLRWGDFDQGDVFSQSQSIQQGWVREDAGGSFCHVRFRKNDGLNAEMLQEASMILADYSGDDVANLEVA